MAPQFVTTLVLKRHLNVDACV